MREPDLLWEAWTLHYYGTIAPNIPRTERGAINKYLRELREINATPEQLISKAKLYSNYMPRDCKLTLAGLVKNWGRINLAKTSTPQASYVPPATPSLSERLSGLQYARDHLPPMFRRKS